VCAALYTGIHRHVLPSRTVYFNSLVGLQPLFGAADTKAIGLERCSACWPLVVQYVCTL